MNETLEQYIDMHGLPFVLDGLAQVCAEKASHLRSNWQDNTSARRWDKRCDLLEQLALRLARP